MKATMVLLIVSFLSTFVFSPCISLAQPVMEIDGKVKVAVMDMDNSAHNIVVSLADGTLATREASSLHVQQTDVGNYGTVTNPVTGKTWLDRNLGAVQVAGSSSDTDSYGDLYQWGRGADGHQNRLSLAIAVQATTWLVGGPSWNDEFIITFQNWLSTGEEHMWSGTNAENNPCPSGFRIPTNAEWEQERLSWTTNDAAGAFASPLKLPVSGYRSFQTGLPTLVSDTGFYWSSSADGNHARLCAFNDADAGLTVLNRADGLAVRCIMD